MRRGTPHWRATLGNYFRVEGHCTPPILSMCSCQEPTIPESIGFHQFEIVIICRNCSTIFLILQCYMAHLKVHQDCNLLMYASFEIMCNEKRCNTLWWTPKSAQKHYKDCKYDDPNQHLPSIFCHICKMLFIDFTTELYAHFLEHLDDLTLILTKYTNVPDHDNLVLNPTPYPEFPNYLVIYSLGSFYHQELIRVGRVIPPIESDDDSESLDWTIESNTTDSGFTQDEMEDETEN